VDPRISSTARTRSYHVGRRLQWPILDQIGFVAAAACLILVVFFSDLQDHLFLYFRMVACGLLDWIE
jgi:hypothetical protein